MVPLERFIIVGIECACKLVHLLYICYKTQNTTLKATLNGQMYFEEIKREKIFLCTYAHTSIFGALLPDDLSFHLVSFPFSFKNFFKVFLEVEVL